MGAHTVITHASNQGHTPAPACGVSLSKITDSAPALPVVLVMDMGRSAAEDIVAPVRVNLTRRGCDWCDEDAPAMYAAHGVYVPVDPAYARSRVETACVHHALVYGRFVPAHVIEPFVAAYSVSGEAMIAHRENWGFVESV